ncbi:MULTISPECIES: SET domain-containing protein [Roseateles]|uniref:SET domain-containing protein-lysine N-methyltransferase n=1 Tax=Roseateles albus TaxID=2987525 RepID=A0ABT5KJG3_9BURK|nr:MULTISPECIES: SET domain-containing protein-lysine N-methyltransferase [Roseateles]MCV2361166.1 SET domain-containing protein-lysine N-methyltransferase [Paucibacter sp. TC2R-5]MDC8774021.1 SET domain-containing protein-lysine N-methyltransferase [Roseateles albus]
MSFATSDAHQDAAVRVRRSRIDGYGVFADEAVLLGAKLGTLTGEAISVAEARRRAQGRQRIMLVELSASRAIDATCSADAMRFTNHSCAPNARIQVEDGAVEFFALRNLAVGDEITVDYGLTHHEGRLACRCGQPDCKNWL